MNRGALVAALAAAGALSISFGCGDGRSLGAPEGITVGKALPLPSGSCTLTTTAPSLAPVTATASWDAVGSTFRIGTAYWTVDARGLVIERGDTAAGWRQLYDYDEHGVTRAFTYQAQGVEVPANSFDQVNHYDGDGRLVAAERTHRDGALSVAFTYLFKSSRLVATTQTRTLDGQPPEQASSLLTWDGDLVRERSSSPYATAEPTRETRAYDDGGRLIRVDTDAAGVPSSSPGAPDMREQWIYDGKGRLIRYELDGLTDPAALLVDGTPDTIVRFDAACADIAVLPEQLYGLPSWLGKP